MAYEDVEVTRRQIGDPHIAGNGIEVGAGLRPVVHTGIESMIFLDKRNDAEFVEYFKEAPRYPLATLAQAAEIYPQGADFLTAHHVLEHADDPIAVLLEWLGLLKVNGLLYLSLPSEANTCEDKRPKTPIRHILEDYFFSRKAGSYESKQHIYSFALQWTLALEEYRPWFGNGDAQELAKGLLWEVTRTDEHDLHWHTYDLPTLKAVIETAFFLKGVGCEWLTAESSDDSHYLIARATNGEVKLPMELIDFQRDIANLHSRLSSLTARGRAVLR